MIKLNRRWMVAGAAVVAVAGATVGGVAAFAGPSDPTYSSTGNGFHACVSRDGHSRLYDGAIYLNVSHPTCPNGYARLDWDAHNGQPGAPGQPGQDATLSVSATTAVTGWPEGSGWADDQFSRSINLTRQHAATSADCGGTTECWFYTGTVVDQGTFTTNDGAKAPNGNGTSINGTVSGSMVGGAHLEFYASSDTPNPANVPVTATGGAAKPASTSDWYKLAFPAGTTFKAGALTAYKWTYTATSPNTCESWTDTINPGDDGQSEADGNITGVNHC